tara:strand:- start:76 stop:231 length:156 start_codon:yes stop_codon:yes gene_type:complete
LKSAVLPELLGPIIQRGTGGFCFLSWAFDTKTFAFPGAPVVFVEVAVEVSN